MSNSGTKSPGATAIATGAEDVVEGVCNVMNITTIPRIIATHFGGVAA